MLSSPYAYPAPRHIPLAGENGPEFTGGATAPVVASSGWDRHPIALALLVLFAAVILFKVVR